MYPDEAEARELIREAGEWVKKNVGISEESKEIGGRTYVAEQGMRDVEECQTFVMTAPGPDTEGDKNAQRE